MKKVLCMVALAAICFGSTASAFTHVTAVADTGKMMKMKKKEGKMKMKKKMMKDTTKKM